MPKVFRPCAGAIVFNRCGLILLGNRIDCSVNAWQFPQGGIEEDETLESAAQRELFEETSIKSVQIVSSSQHSLCYEFPENVKNIFLRRGIISDGQSIGFTLFYFLGDDSEINVQTEHPEFKDYCWASFDFAVNNVIGFKRDVYLAAKNYFMPIITQYINRLP
ncbi:MAG: RNA pyrophosphohydrolase [Alphaproteobacteria bacterium]|nr:RNA pyrophosphohydrolase [Alphaproteobacteria bacterium]